MPRPSGSEGLWVPALVVGAILLGSAQAARLEVAPANPPEPCRPLQVWLWEALTVSPRWQAQLDYCLELPGRPSPACRGVLKLHRLADWRPILEASGLAPGSSVPSTEEALPCPPKVF